jgi:glycosyltransferase involved in cell wall biosynthesis
MDASSLTVAPTDHDLTVVIPAFNEERRLPRTLETLKAQLAAWHLDYRVVVVDDGSRDETALVASRFGHRFRTLRLTKQSGKGAAVRAGMLQSTGAAAAFTDADLPFELESLRLGYEWIAQGRADLVCGNRELPGSLMPKGRSMARALASRVFRGFVGAVLRLSVTDSQCGLKLFARRVIGPLFLRQQIDGFAFDVEILHWAQRLGVRCQPIPVRLVNDQGSTVSLRRHALPMFLDVVRIYWRSCLAEQPKLGDSFALPAYDVRGLTPKRAA